MMSQLFRSIFITSAVSFGLIAPLALPGGVWAQSISNPNDLCGALGYTPGQSSYAQCVDTYSNPSDYCSNLNYTPGQADHAECTGEYTQALSYCQGLHDELVKQATCFEDRISGQRESITVTTGSGVEHTPIARKDIADNVIIEFLVDIVNVLSAGVGLIVIGMIVVGGIQYSSSRGNPQATAAAINKITNALIALFLYLFLFALLQWLIPGGVFGG